MVYIFQDKNFIENTRINFSHYKKIISEKCNNLIIYDHLENLVSKPYGKFLLHFKKKIINGKNNSRFNFVLSDCDFKDIVDNYIFGKKIYLNILLRHADKIILISDGAGHTNTFIPWLEKNLKLITINNNKKNLRTLKYVKKYNLKLSRNSIFNLFLHNINDNNFISILTYEKNEVNSMLINENLFPNIISTNINVMNTWKLIFKNENKFNKIDNYFKLFIDEKNIIISGNKNIDKKKKNCIFLGSSLFDLDNEKMNTEKFSSLQYFNNLRKIVQSIFENFMNKYDINQYNIIFKLHPKFFDFRDTNNEIPKKYIKMISNNKISNPIIINPYIPIEIFMSFIHYKKNKNIINIPDTFFGFQCSSTSIHTTRLFYEETYNISKLESSLILPFDNFPISRFYSILHRPKKDVDYKTNFLNENVYIFNNIYSYFIPSKRFSDKSLSHYDLIII